MSLTRLHHPLKRVVNTDFGPIVVEIDPGGIGDPATITYRRLRAHHPFRCFVVADPASPLVQVPIDFPPPLEVPL